MMIRSHSRRLLLALLAAALLAGGIAHAQSNEAAVLLGPSPGSTFPDTTVTFTWSAGVGVQEYELAWGLEDEEGLYWVSSQRGTSLSRTVTGLPSSGELVTVGLTSYFADGTTGYRQYSFTAMPANPLATLASPTPGSTLPDTTVTFTWTAGVEVLEYGLQVGTTPGGTNLLDVSTGTERSYTLTGLPSNNRPVYVRLRSRRASGWQALDYSFTALDGSATLLGPSPGSTFADTTVTFTWSAGVGAQEYELAWGLEDEEGLYWVSSQRGTSLSQTVTGLPSSGQQVTVGLFSYFADGTTGYRQYTFTAMPANPLATLTSPTPGSRFPDTTVTFTWTAGVEVLEYGLQVGTTPGGTNLADVATGTERSYTLTGLPSNNRPVYVRLRSRRASGWQSLDYSFTALDGSATLLGPSPGSTFPDTTVTFTWSAGVGVQEYELAWGLEDEEGLYWVSSQRGTSLSRTLTGLPSSGEQVTVGLTSYFADGTVGERAYTFTAMASNPLATLASPTPGSRFPDTTVTFTWTAGVEVLEYGLQVGTTLGGTNLLDVSTGTERSYTLAGLPSNNRPVYVRLRSRRASGWQALDYSFTALDGSATLLGPSPGSTFADTTVTFTWSAGVGVQEYELAWGLEDEEGLYWVSSQRGTSLSQTVTGLPSSGELVTVGLTSYFTDGTTGYRQYTFTAKTTTSQDTTPPVITLVSGPPDPTNNRTLSLRVSGADSVTPADQLQFAFSLDSETAYSAYGSSPTMTFSDVPDGSHTIRVKGRDQAGNVSAPLVVTVRVDTVPPAITVTAPAPGFLTNQSAVTVSGTVTDASTITALTVNGQAASVTGSSFSHTLTLAEGANTITVTATDAAGNTGTATTSATLDTLGPALTITSPAPGTTTNQTTLAVQGTVTDATGVASVVVNGVPATLTAGTFVAMGVSLPMEGPNVLTITATDTLGNTATTGITVTRVTTASPPVILAFEPASAPVGVALTIRGTGFGTTPSENVVTFAGATQGRLLALVEGASPTQLTVRVPEGAQSGPVTVQVGGTTSNAFEFIVEGPAPRRITGPVGSILVGGSPAGIAVHQGLNLGVVAKPTEGTVALVGLASRQVAGEIPIGGQPLTVAVSEELGQAFVGDAASPTLARVDLQTRSLLDVVPLAAVPSAIAVSEALALVFVAHEAANSVTVFDAFLGTIQDTLPSGGGPVGIAVADSSREVWVASRDSKTLSGFDGVAPDYFPLGTASLPEAPEQLVIHEIPGVSRTAVVAFPEASQVTLVDLVSPQVVRALPVGIRPRGVAVTQEGLALVANFATDSVSVIDLFTRSVIATVPAGQGSIATAVHETLKLGLVTNATDGTVTLIDLKEPPAPPEPPGPTGPPVVVGLTTTSAPVGTLVVVRGLEFDASPGGSTVTFNSPLGRLIAPVLAASATELVVRVPEGATPGPVGVSTRAGVSLGTDSFEVVAGDPPSLQIVSPADGAVISAASVDVEGLVDLPTPATSVVVNGVSAEVTGPRFRAPNVPLLPLEPTMLAATAVDAQGTQARVAVTVLPTIMVMLRPSPRSGVAPLSVTFSMLSTLTPASVELDFEGDGTVDFAGPSLEGQAFSYTQAGIYSPTVTVTDAQGNRFTTRTSVQVFDQGVLDSALKDQWDALRDGLRLGDIERAVEVFVPSVRAAYSDTFAALAGVGALPQVAAELGTISLVRVRDGAAEYELRAMRDGIEYSFQVLFVIDTDGAWRLLGF